MFDKSSSRLWVDHFVATNFMKTKRKILNLRRRQSAGTHPDFLLLLFSTNHQPDSSLVTTLTTFPFDIGNSPPLFCVFHKFPKNSDFFFTFKIFFMISNVRKNRFCEENLVQNIQIFILVKKIGQNFDPQQKKSTKNVTFMTKNSTKNVTIFS